MTKKEFIESADYHQYRGAGKDNGNMNALFYDWQQGTTIDNKLFIGFKFGAFARQCNATKKELTDVLYDFVTGRINKAPWYITLVYAKTNEQRWKVPISGSGLHSLPEHDDESYVNTIVKPAEGRKYEFYQAELRKLNDKEVMEVTNGLSVKERMGENAICPECGDNRWWLLPKAGAAVRTGGKPYCECINCGYTTHM